MLKRIILLLSIFLLCSCSFKSDYFTLYVDDYSFTVGYDNIEYLKYTFDLDVEDTLEANQTIKDINVYSFDKLFCKVDIENLKDKTINSDDAIISKLTLYCLDVGDRTYKINDTVLDKFVTSDCDKFNGNLIKKNGYACIIEKQDKDKMSVIELHGDILNLDQDKLDHIVIYVLR